MRIGVLASATGTSPKTVRFYEEACLMPAPPRTPAGYRDYPAAATDRLAFIRDAQAAGLTLAEIRSVLAIRDSGETPCAHVSDLINQHLTQIEQRIAELHQARSALQDLAHKAATTDPSTCGESDVCRILRQP